jgi:hypothetical protein
MSQDMTQQCLAQRVSVHNLLTWGTYADRVGQAQMMFCPDSPGQEVHAEIRPPGQQARPVCHVARMPTHLLKTSLNCAY